MNQDFFEVSVNAIKMIVVFLMMVQAVPILVWLERRGSAFIQNRFGPNRIGPFGLMQLLADAAKFFFKEPFVPANGTKFLYFAAPVLALIPASLAFMAIPLSTPVNVGAFSFAEAFSFLQSIGLGGLHNSLSLMDSFTQQRGPYQFAWQGMEVNVGIVYVLGMSSLAAYAILTAGWGSGNKYSLLGALRASSQIISYELALGLSVVGVILLYGTFNLTEMIVAQQGPLSFTAFGYTIKAISGYLPNWGIFFQPLGAIIFFAATFAESNRLPFDLAEGEAELVAGFHVEYGGFKMLMFFIGEYGHMMVAAGLMTTFFFGGYAIPGSTSASMLVFMQNAVGMGTLASFLTGLAFFASFSFKFAIFLWIFIQVRWTLPRFRYDQLMDLGWKTMLPWALVNTIATAVVIWAVSAG